MTSGQDINSTAQAESLESPKDGAQNQSAQISTSDALSDSALDDVSGGTWPFNNLARASYAATGGAG